MDIIETLTKLQLIEGKKFDTLRRRKEALNSLQKLHLQHERLLKEKADRDKELLKLERELKDLELFTESRKDKIKSAKELLYSGRITSPKEILSKNQELENLKKQVDELEDKELMIMEAIEVGSEKRSELEEELKKKYLQIKEQEANIPEWKEEDSIEDLKPQLPPELLTEFYHLFKTKGGVAVASLKDGLHCGGCGVAVSLKLQRSVQKGELVRCESCHRLLCLPRHF